MNKQLKKGDGISTISVVVITVILVVTILVPGIKSLLEDQAKASQTLGVELTNVAENAIENK